MKPTVLSKLPFLLLAVQVVVLIAATIAEHVWGSATAYARFYSTVGFRLLWAAIVVTGAWVIVRRRLWHRLHALALHTSFVVILVGACAPLSVRSMGVCICAWANRHISF